MNSLCGSCGKPLVWLVFNAVCPDACDKKHEDTSPQQMRVIAIKGQRWRVARIEGGIAIPSWATRVWALINDVDGDRASPSKSEEELAFLWEEWGNINSTKRFPGTDVGTCGDYNKSGMYWACPKVVFAPYRHWNRRKYAQAGINCIERLQR